MKAFASFCQIIERLKVLVKYYNFLQCRKFFFKGFRASTQNDLIMIIRGVSESYYYNLFAVIEWSPCTHQFPEIISR